VSPVEWGEGDAAPEPVPAASEPSGWPTRLAGYWKVLLGALSTVGVGGVFAWLQSAGVTHLPPWATAGITALVTIVLLLFGPRNKA
jgi:hypothetical protein